MFLVVHDQVVAVLPGQALRNGVQAFGSVLGEGQPARLSADQAGQAHTQRIGVAQPLRLVAAGVRDAIEEGRDGVRHLGRQRAGVGDVGVGLVTRDGKQLPEFVLPAHARPSV
ncbi:hypothetical protein G6F31_020438 [Rhizopus arrhizus]|nr:hypothetical protein G6F31_020438 [Rhizopus arrhizus]